jgi:hypothetical protein
LIPDVLIDVNDGPIVVVELKFSRAGRAELDQLQSYLRLPTIVRRCAGRPIAGALIARTFSEEILPIASAASSDVSLYQFGYDGNLTLHHVTGDRVLEQHRLA